MEVTIGGKDSYISEDGNRLNIAAMPMTHEGRMVTIGLGFHEVGHKLYSDIPEAIAPGLLGNLTNIIEDVREERDFIRDRPGASYDLRAVTDWYQARGNYIPTDMQTAFRCLVLCTGYSAVLGFSSVLPDLAKAEEIISKEMGGGFLSLAKLILQHFPSLPYGKEGTAASKEMAIALCKLLEDEVKKKEQEQQDQTSQDNQQDDSQGSPEDKQNKEDDNPEKQNQDEEQSGSDDESSESSNDNGDQDENSPSGDQSSDSRDNPSQDDHTDQGGQDEDSEQNGSGKNPSKSDTDDEEGDGNDAGNDNGSSSTSSSDDSTTPNNNSIASGNSIGGQKEDSKTQLSAREIMQILEGESDFGDVQKIALKELERMSQEVSDDVRSSIPQLPRSKRFDSDTNLIDENVAISATSRMRAKLMGMLQSVKQQPERFGTSGRKLAVNRLVNMATGDPRIFKKRTETVSINTAVVIMVDNSGSMTTNRRIEIARDSSFALHHTLKGIGGVSVLSAAFDASSLDPRNPDSFPIKMLCGWNEKPFPMQFSIRPGDITPTPWALWFARAQLLQRPEPRKICLVITDGEPFGWDNIESDTVAATKRLEKDRIEIAAIGIQLDDVAKYWKNNRVVNNVDDLPQAMFGVMNDLLTRKPNT
jgi:Mg-chelatase subunit ChlD